MAILIPRNARYWQRKPSRPQEIDGSNHFASMPSVLFTMFSEVRDARHERDLVLYNDAHFEQNELVVGNATDEVAKTSTWALLQPANAITVVVGATRTGTPANYGKIFHYGRNDRGPYGPYGFEQQAATASSLQFHLALTGSGSVAAGATDMMPINEQRITAGRYDGSTLSIFSDGTERGSTSGSGTITDYSGYGLSIGDSSEGTGNYPCRVPFLYIFPDIALSDGEIQSLADNPYQVLKPRKTYFLFPDTGAAPTFNPAWARNNNKLYGGGFQ